MSDWQNNGEGWEYRDHAPMDDLVCSDLCSQMQILLADDPYNTSVELIRTGTGEQATYHLREWRPTDS